MSLFYNVKLTGGTELKDANINVNHNDTLAEFRTTRSNFILEKQNDYQVGVCRFKVPSKEIPLFNISEGKIDDLPYYSMYSYNIGKNLGLSAGTESGNLRIFVPSNGYSYKSQPSYLNGDGLGLRMVGHSTTTRSLNQTTQFPHKPIYNKGIYINNEDDWLDYMNALSMNAMTGLKYNFQYNNAMAFINAPHTGGNPPTELNHLILRVGTSNTWNNGGAGAGATTGYGNVVNFKPNGFNDHQMTPLIQSNDSFLAEVVYPTPSNNVGGVAGVGIPLRKVFNFCIGIHNIRMLNGGSLKDVSIRLFAPPNNTTNLRKSWVIAQSLGMEGDVRYINRMYFSPMFPDKLSKLIGRKRSDGQESFPLDTGNAVNLCFHPDGDDFSDFFNGGIDAHDPEANRKEGWIVEIKNNGNGQIQGSQLRLDFNLFDEIQETRKQTGTSGYSIKSPYCGLKIPTYTYKIEYDLIEYNIDRQYYEVITELLNPRTNKPIGFSHLQTPPRMGFQTFFNDNLNNLFNFPSVKVPKRYDITTDPASPYAETTITWDLTDPSPAFLGKNINSLNNQGSFIYVPLIDMTSDTGEGLIILNEGSSSQYLRRNLHSLIFATNVLSVKGELLSSGQETRKILTDFETNPDVNSTYIQFFSQGYMRYYPLESDLPLKDVGLKIFYETIQGDINALIIPNGQLATIKLEFRPNNMILTN